MKRLSRSARRRVAFLKAAAPGRPLIFEQLESRSMLSANLNAAQVQSAYGINDITFPGSAIAGNGAGQTIAIIDAGNDSSIASDLATFDSQQSLPAPPSFTVVGETGGAPPTYPSATITYAAELGNTVTITTAVPHNLSINTPVSIDFLGAGYNGTFEVTKVLSAYQFSYTASVQDLPVSSGGIVVPANPVDSSETSLDVEWAHAIAPAAKILLVEETQGFSSNAASAVNTAVADGASVVSMSFGNPEFSGETNTAKTACQGITSATESGNTVTITMSGQLPISAGNSVTIANVGVAGYNGTFQVLAVTGSDSFTFTDRTSGLGSSSGGSATVALFDDGLFNVPGVTFVSASGDNGTPAVYPASSPNVLSVGATNLTLNSNGSYQTETGWSNPAAITNVAVSGGIATITTATATGLETGDLVELVALGLPADDGTFTVTGTPTSTSFTFAAPAGFASFSPVSGYALAGDFGVGSNHGGSGGGPSAFELQPSYQASVPASMSTLSSVAYRTTPDVSIVGGSASPVTIVIDGGDYLEAGTSLSAPLWAGLIAIADQGRTLRGAAPLSGASQTLPYLYKLPGSDFHDVTIGYNGYSAAPGYDLVSGLGTPIANLLIPGLAEFGLTPVITLTDGGTYNTAPFPATVSVDGQSSLEGVAPSLTYYSGSNALGSPLAGPPSNAGTYTVVASFAGSTDYPTASANKTFTIAPATPTLVVTDAGGTYTPAGYPASATVAGVGNQSTPAASLEGVQPVLIYYSGTAAAGTPLGTPTAVGTYTVVASFAGSQDYSSASVSTRFTIAPLTIAFLNQQNTGGHVREPLSLLGFNFTSTGTQGGKGLIIQDTSDGWPTTVLQAEYPGTLINMSLAGGGTFGLYSLTLDSFRLADSAVVNGYNAAGTRIDQQIVSFSFGKATEANSTVNMAWTGLSLITISWWSQANGTGQIEWGALQTVMAAPTATNPAFVGTLARAAVTASQSSTASSVVQPGTAAVSPAVMAVSMLSTTSASAASAGSTAVTSGEEGPAPSTTRSAATSSTGSPAAINLSAEAIDVVLAEPVEESHL